VDVTVELDAPLPPATLFAAVEDLDRYPSWLDIVPRADRLAPEPAAPGSAAPPPAWSVDLRGRVGPLARSKRLRMVRTVHEPDAHVRFERVETDGRQHSPWVLDALVAPTAAGSRLTMVLHYGGGLFGPILERVLVEEIERSKARLLALLAG
jgi:hypothetical protein